MNANVLYWTGATVNMAAVVGLVIFGVAQIRRGEVVRHRRAMLAAGTLVVAFLGSYLLKVAFLGKEDRGAWSPVELQTLYLHETCVTLMLLASLVALSRAWRMRGSRRVTGSFDDPEPPESVVRLHRRAGWTAVVGAVLGFLTAGVVLYGMYARL